MTGKRVWLTSGEVDVIVGTIAEKASYVRLLADDSKGTEYGDRAGKHADALASVLKKLEG